MSQQKQSFKKDLWIFVESTELQKGRIYENIKHLLCDTIRDRLQLQHFLNLKHNFQVAHQINSADRTTWIFRWTLTSQNLYRNIFSLGKIIMKKAIIYFCDSYERCCEVLNFDQQPFQSYSSPSQQFSNSIMTTLSNDNNKNNQFITQNLNKNYLQDNFDDKNNNNSLYLNRINSSKNKPQKKSKKNLNCNQDSSSNSVSSYSSLESCADNCSKSRQNNNKYELENQQQKQYKRRSSSSQCSQSSTSTNNYSSHQSQLYNNSNINNIQENEALEVFVQGKYQDQQCNKNSVQFSNWQKHKFEDQYYIDLLRNQNQEEEASADFKLSKKQQFHTHFSVDQNDVEKRLELEKFAQQVWGGHSKQNLAKSDFDEQSRESYIQDIEFYVSQLKSISLKNEILKNEIIENEKQEQLAKEGLNQMQHRMKNKGQNFYNKKQHSFSQQQQQQQYFSLF